MPRNDRQRFRRRIKSPLPTIAILACFAVLSPPAAAQIKTWRAGGSDLWSHGSNWTPSGVPEINEGVVIDVARLVLLDEDSAALAGIAVVNGGALVTNDFELQVDRGTGVTRVQRSGSQIVASRNSSPKDASLRTTILQVMDDGALTMNGGRAVVNRSVALVRRGRIDGHGTMIVRGDQVSKLSNAGLIVSRDGRLEIVSEGEGSFDLDAGGEGSLQVTTGSELVISSDVRDTFGSSIHIAGDALLRIDAGLKLTGFDPGQLIFEAGDEVARLEGGHYVSHGEVLVRSGTVHLDVASFINESGGSIDVDAETEMFLGTTLEQRGTLTLTGGTVSGNQIVNSGEIMGYGRILTVDIDNNGTLSGRGGRLIIDTAARFPDIDGSQAGGRINAIKGDVEVSFPADSAAVFSGHLRVSNGNTFFVGGHTVLLGERATARFAGGNFVGGGLTQNPGSGPIIVEGDAESKIDSRALSLLNESVKLGAPLRLLGRTAISGSAQITGAGGLIIDRAGVVETRDGAVISTALANEGELTVGHEIDGPSLLTIDQYLHTGRLRLDFARAEKGGYDRVLVMGNVKLDGGTLEINFVDGYRPQPGDAFAVMTAVGSIEGGFTTLDIPELGDALHARVDVEVSGVTVVFTSELGEAGFQRPGDCNQDGELDLSDPLCTLRHLFQATSDPAPCDGGAFGAGTTTLLDNNGDGSVDLSDAVYMLSFLFTSGAEPVLGGFKCVRISGCPNACPL